MDKEIWKNVPIEDYSDYEVSSDGEVRRNGKVLKQSTQNNGYSIVILYNHSKYKHFLVHRLVAITFLPTNDIKQDVNHIDGNKKNIV